YFTHVWMHFQNVAFSWLLVGSVLKRFFAIKFTDGWHILVTICDLAISAAIPWTPWGKLPKFVPVFQTIQPDGSLTQTLAQGVAAQ
ncbi:MAG TPA: hypothetical protein VKT33_14795, partial [Candidatus Angelobacter sp.]|nr:hypothetical protein [Candidatus Angelobacter sp.]